MLPACTVIIVVVGCPGIRDGAEDTGDTRVTKPAEQSEKRKRRQVKKTKQKQLNKDSVYVYMTSLFQLQFPNEQYLFIHT